MVVFCFDFSFGLKYTHLFENDLHLKDTISNYPSPDIEIDETFNYSGGFLGPYISFLFGDRINLYLSGNLGFTMFGSISGSDIDPDIDGVTTDSELGILFKNEIGKNWEMLIGPGIHYGWTTINEDSDIGTQFGAGIISIFNKRISENFAFSFTGDLYYNFLNNNPEDYTNIIDAGNGFSLIIGAGMTF